MGLLPWLTAAWLLGIGLYGIVTSRNYVHLIGCLAGVQSATYVLLLAAGYRWNAIAPIFYNHPPGTPAVDQEQPLQANFSVSGFRTSGP